MTPFFAWLSACASLTCGPGTMRDGDVCVATADRGASPPTAASTSPDSPVTQPAPTTGGTLPGPTTPPAAGPEFVPFVDASLYPFAILGEVAPKL